ncbi:TetR/AcrR family transcriptional regulator [Gemmobacter megaterium]|nr:TetR/AcrR family transcriptional regulator [Gemmobacter megaterium]
MPRSVRPTASPWPNSDMREGERAAKRDAVLRTAARFFNQRGYHATSLDDVAAALNVTKPTIYHYFANKDEILYECTRRGLDEIAAIARSTAGQNGTAADRLRQMLTAYALIMLDDFGICVSRTQDHLLSPESRRGFRALKREIDLLVRQVIAEGVADGSLAVPDVRMAAFTAGVALNGLGTWFRPDGPVGAEETARLTVAVLMNGMCPPPRTSTSTEETTE